MTDHDRKLYHGSIWLSGLEAITQIMSATQCDATTAWNELRIAISEETILVKWASMGPKFIEIDGELSQVFLRERPISTFWKNAEMNFQSGFVLDDSKTRIPNDPTGAFRRQLIQNGQLSYRAFVVLYAAIIAYWPARESNGQPFASSARPAQRKSPGPKNNEPIIWATLDQMRAEGYNFNKVQDAIAADVCQRNKRKPDSKGWGSRSVKGHIKSWLDANPESRELTEMKK